MTLVLHVVQRKLAEPISRVLLLLILIFGLSKLVVVVFDL